MMTTMKRLTAVGLIAAAAMGAQQANAAAATTMVHIDFPQILVLYTYDNIYLGVDEASMLSAMGVAGVACPSPDLCIGVGDLGTLGVPIPLDLSTGLVPGNMSGEAATAVGDMSAVAVSITDSWGVRSIATGNLDTSITGPGTLVGAGTAIPVPSATITPSGPASLPPGLALQTGDIGFTMNLNNLDAPGAYSGGFIITVDLP